MMYRFYIYHADLKQPVRLQYDPEGWNEQGKTRKRDMTWHGVFFEYTQKLRFVKDGRNLVAYFYETYGVEAELVLIVQKFSRAQRTFKTYYTGRFNLTSLKITTLYAECNIEQTGFLQKFKNRQDIKVNLSSLVTQSGKAIEANASETEEIELHSKVLVKNFQTDFTPNQTQLAINLNANRFLQISLEPTELNEIIDFFDYPNQVTDANPVDDKKYNWKIRESGSYTFNINLHQRVYAFTLFGAPPTVNEEDIQNLEWFFVYGKPGAYVTISMGQWSHNGADPIVGLIVEPTYSATINLNAEDEVYLYADVRVSSDLSGVAPLNVTRFENFNVSITANTTVPATNAPVVLLHEAFARVVESITDEPDSFRSEYYGRTDSEPTAYDADGLGSLRGLINGSLIRGFPLVNKPVIISFKDLFEMGRAIDGIGVGITTTGLKQRVHVGPLTDFYKPQRVLQFAFVKDIEKEVATQFLYNELEAGYDRWNNERLNNLDEFNTKSEFALPLTQVRNRLSLRSPVIASGYTIEFVRRDRYIDGTTKDNDRDNDNFIIQLRRDDGSYVTDKDEDFAELNNLISPETVYNAKLSVMRNIRRNGRYIRSGLQHQEEAYIKRTYGEGNTTFSSRLSSEAAAINENQVQVKDLDRPLWLPELYTFKVKPTEAQNDALDADPYGLIEFSVSDKDFKKGYLVETVPDDESDLTTFKVLKANL